MFSIGPAHMCFISVILSTWISTFFFSIVNGDVINTDGIINITISCVLLVFNIYFVWVVVKILAERKEYLYDEAEAINSEEAAH